MRDGFGLSRTVAPQILMLLSEEGLSLLRYRLNPYTLTLNMALV